MTHIFRSVFLALLVSPSLLAGTVLITTLPDENRELAPLTSLEGIPLSQGTLVRVGAFPSLDDDQILDLASQGLDKVVAAFVPFGESREIGQGADGAAGGFEIAVKDSSNASAWAGQTVSLLIQTVGGEFLVARFPGKVFE
ncbi:MAG: hypothetical protein EOP85_14375, partial [Verrucomicrobiaceae bacterium]